MSELEDRIDELEHENEKLRWQLEDLEARFEAFAEPCAIGSEQLWKVVFHDILKRPIPPGVNLRDLV